MQVNDPNKLVRVELPLTNYTSVRSGEGEPQPVTARVPSAAEIYLSTRQLPASVPRNDYIISAPNLFQNVSRVGFGGSTIANYFVPNVNQRNNRIGFILQTNPGVTYWATVPELFYNTINTIVANASIAALATAVQTALNAVVVPGPHGPVVFTVTATEDPNEITGAFNITGKVGGIGILWAWDPTSSMITKGDTMFNLSQVYTDGNPLYHSVHQIGPFGFMYTTHIDITSRVLTQYTKMRSVTSDNRSNIFARTSMGRNNLGAAVYGFTNSGPITPTEISFSYKPDVNISSIDIQLYDSHGDLLYIPSYLNNNMIVDIKVRVEM